VIRIRHQARGEEGLDMRMRWMIEDLFGPPLLDDPALMHDKHAISEVADDGKAVGDGDALTLAT